MRRRILTGVLVCTTAIVIGVVAVGEILTGPAATAVDSLSSDFPVEPVQIPVNTDTHVRGWLTRGVRDGGVVLLLHSMRSNRLEMLSRARFLHAQGYGVFLIDLQAHGESPGKRITFGVREAAGVQAAVAFLRQTFPSERLAAIGTSLGAAAIVLAKHPLKLDAVVLESLHPTIEEAVENRLRLHLGEWGTALLPLLLTQLSLYLDVSIDELSPITRIGNLNTPLLLIAGTDDQHTKVPESERLFAAARQPKDLWIVPGAGHFNMHSYAGREYEKHISDFLAQYLRPGSREQTWFRKNQ